MSLTCIDLPRRDRSNRVRDVYSLNKLQQQFPNDYNDKKSSSKLKLLILP